MVNIMPLSVNRAWLCMWTYSMYDSSVSAYRSKGVFCKPTAMQGLNSAGIDNRSVDPDPRANSEQLEKVWCGENPTTVSFRENNSMGNVQGLLLKKNFSSCLPLSSTHPASVCLLQLHQHAWGYILYTMMLHYDLQTVLTACHGYKYTLCSLQQWAVINAKDDHWC